MTRALDELLDPTIGVIFVLVVGFLFVGWAAWELASRRSEEHLKETIAQGVGRSMYLTVHGGRSPYYFDTDSFLADPENVRLVGSWFQSLMAAENEHGDPVDCLAFVEKREGPVGSLTLEEYLSDITGIPSVTVRLRKRILGLSFKSYSRWRQIVRSRARIILVSDVATTGGTIEEAIEKMRRGGGRVDIAAVIHDREDERCAGRLAALGIRLERFSTMSLFKEMLGDDFSRVQEIREKEERAETELSQSRAAV